MHHRPDPLAVCQQAKVQRHLRSLREVLAVAISLVHWPVP